MLFEQNYDSAEEYCLYKPHATDLHFHHVTGGSWIYSTLELTSISLYCDNERAKQIVLESGSGTG